MDNINITNDILLIINNILVDKGENYVCRKLDFTN